MRDFYFFRRNFYPQLTLVHMNPEEAAKGLQKQVRTTLSVFQSTAPSNFVSKHISSCCEPSCLLVSLSSLLEELPEGAVCSRPGCQLFDHVLRLANHLQAYILKMVEIGKVLFSTSIIQHSPSQQVSSSCHQTGEVPAVEFLEMILQQVRCIFVSE